MNERFAYLVERLYRANCRMDRCRTDRDYQCARWWLHGWNAAINNNITGRRINIASQEKSFLMKNKWIECGHAKRMDEKMKPGQSMKAQDAVPDFWTIGKYFLVEYRYQLVDRLNSALGQPSSELARIEARFLLCRMDPGESLAFIEVSLGLLAEQSLHRRNCRPRAV